MRSSFVVLALAFVATPLGPALAEELPVPAGWKEGTRSPEITIFFRENDQVHAREFQAIGPIDAPPDVVFAVVTDVENHPKFMPYEKESRIVDRPGPNEIVVYQVIDAPVIENRDYFLHIKTTPGATPNTTWKSEWYSVPDFQPERKGFVRMRVAQGYWLFEPLDGGRRTRLTYTSLTTIGGLVPQWIANSSNMSIIPKMYEAVRKRVALRLAQH
jgi:uncharacterized protein YndB with AHSA1/START domain